MEEESVSNLWKEDGEKEILVVILFYRKGREICLVVVFVGVLVC